MVCIRVPYVTHLWQVADSSELNGSYKIDLTETRKKFLQAKPPGQKQFGMTDIIPLVRHAWEQSFGRADIAKKAVSNRGWGPLNYSLLDSPDLICDDRQNIGENKRKINQASTDKGKVNHDGEVATGYLMMLIEDKLKSDALHTQLGEKQAEKGDE
jgi:hypothetical protein